MHQNQEKLVRLPDGSWQIAGNRQSDFAPNYFDRFPQHRLAGQARAIVAAEKAGHYVRIKPISFHNLKGK